MDMIESQRACLFRFSDLAAEDIALVVFGVCHQTGQTSQGQQNHSAHQIDHQSSTNSKNHLIT